MAERLSCRTRLIYGAEDNGFSLTSTIRGNQRQRGIGRLADQQKAVLRPGSTSLPVAHRSTRE
jgi:hypothetical protein